MKILFTCAYYPPDRAASMYLTMDLAEMAVKRGHCVHIVTPVPTRGLSDEEFKTYKRRRKEVNFNGKLLITRFWLYREGEKPVGRALRYLCCNIWHLFYGLFCDYDLLFVDSTPPTQGVVASIIKFFRRKPIVYNAQDIFPDSLVSTGLASDKGLAWKIGKRIERITYKSSDFIIVISESMRANLLGKSVPSYKIKSIYNWVDPNLVRNIPDCENCLFDKLKIDSSKFRIVYAGNLGHAQNIDIIIDAAKRLVNLGSVEFIIFGEGTEKDRICKRVDRENISNIKLFPLQPAAMVSEVYSLGNVAIVSCKKGFGGIAMPSKLWNIMSTGTPVIASFDVGTDMQHLLSTYDFGWFSEAGNLNSFISAINEAVLSKSRCKEKGINARRFVETNVTKDICTNRYIDIFERVYGRAFR